MKFLRLIFLVLAVQLGGATSTAFAADTRPSAQAARYEQLLREPVASDPAAQLPVAGAMAALGRPAQAEALRGALVGLMIRRSEGEPDDPALTVGGLLARPGFASPPTPDSPVAEAWSGAVNRHVQLRFLDAGAADGLSLPADARSDLQPVAPGLWASPTPVGALILFVTVHQGQPAPLWITRLHVAWLDTQLTCLPAHGRGGRAADVVFACEGTSHAATLPALRKAVLSTPGPALSGGVRAGEFDTPTATSAWIDAMAAGRDAELERLLARQAPCESAADPAQRCVMNEVKASPAPNSNARRADAAQEAQRSRPSSDGESVRSVLNHLAGWFFGGALVSWLACKVARSSSLVVELVAIVVIVHVLLFLSWLGLILFWGMWNSHFGDIGIGGAFVWGSLYMALASGIAAGGVVQAARRVLDGWQDARGWRA